MSVAKRSILPPYVGDPAHQPDQPSEVDPTTGMRNTGAGLDIPSPPYPNVSSDPMGETGVDNNTTQARHAGMVQDHQSAAAREAGRGAALDNHSGEGMVIGSASPLVTEGGDGGHGDADADTPNQGSPMKTIAGSDNLSIDSEGDSGPQTGAGKALG